MITERTLKKWRKAALSSAKVAREYNKKDEYSEIIIRLTQELLDQHLLKEVKK